MAARLTLDLDQVQHPAAWAGRHKLDLGQWSRMLLWQSAINQHVVRSPDMFIDEVVFAGVLIVGLCVVFCAGFAYFIWKDAKKTKSN
ncbi:cytochrome c oxidase subunit CcoM [Pseudomonas sp.]|uniref:cytochrome c oxidase subunit CcoM n=1 Tax=Pseudomonas sp. TaxID=306 RepID=UPI0039C9D4B1